MNPGLLPTEVLFRTKEAFSDGVSSLDRSWYEIIHEKLTYELGPGVGIDLEKKYYLDIFDKEYQGRSDIVPYYWMPKYLVVSDPSARIIN
jgi:asparagine synthase (glutamine-hydrolysing)